MSDFCLELGYKSIIHIGEQLCGDNIDILQTNENSKVIVLSDGLGSGVKASILATLTSKVLSKMFANELSLEECVATIDAILPVCSVRGVAYSTFTVKHLKDNKTAEIIQYDNPQVIILRDGQIWDYPMTKNIVCGKPVYISEIELKEDDIFVAITGSDGKTTTTTLISKMLIEQGYKTWLGGNIGTPLLTKTEDMSEEDFVVLELSSFQLHTMKKSPHIAVITNISPNHLDMHKDYQEYIDAKKNIMLHQKNDDVLIVNADNDVTSKIGKEAKGTLKSFSRIPNSIKFLM